MTHKQGEKLLHEVLYRRLLTYDTKDTKTLSQLHNFVNIWAKIQEIQKKLSKFIRFQEKLGALTKFYTNLKI